MGRNPGHPLVGFREVDRVRLTEGTTCEPNLARAACCRVAMQWPARKPRGGLRRARGTPRAAENTTPPGPVAVPGRAPAPRSPRAAPGSRSEEHTSELQSHHDLVCRLLLEKKK